MTPALLARRSDGAVLALPLSPGDDAIEVGAAICRLAEPGWHAKTEWCVVGAPSTRDATWPNPEPWIARR